MDHRIFRIKEICDRLNKRNQNPQGHNISGDILNVLSEWTPQKDDLDGLLELSRQSLDEVKHLTEYEDDKANRILTAMAFLSAFAAVVFGVVVDKIPFTDIVRNSDQYSVAISIGLALVYLLFTLFCFLVALGAVYVIYAIKPRFTIPRTWKDDGREPASFLFAPKIIEVSPKKWAIAFREKNSDQLKQSYIKNCVHETYLVADKIKVKLRKLQKGVKFFVWSAVVLTAWLPLCIVMIALVSEFDDRNGYVANHHKMSRYIEEPTRIDLISDVQKITRTNGIYRSRF